MALSRHQPLEETPNDNAAYTRRIEGTQKTIQAVLDRVADERKKKDLLGANIVRLKKIHAIGLRILQSTKANYDTAH